MIKLRPSSGARGSARRGLLGRLALLGGSCVAAGALCASLTAQEPEPEPDPTAPQEEAEALPDVRLSLTPPKSKLFATGASEWSVTALNRSGEPMPFSPLVLTPEPYGSVGVYFEVRRGEEDPTLIKPGPHMTVPRCGAGPPSQFLAPDESATLPFVLHGRMGYDAAAAARGDEVTIRFAPAFPLAGRYTVTPMLHWRGQRVRGVPTVVEVALNSNQSANFTREYQSLVAKGFCVDVTDVYAPRTLDQLEQVAAVIALDENSIFGAQLRIGFAKKLFQWEQTRYDSRRASEVDCSLSRIKQLIRDPMPMHFGLDRTLAELRKEIADVEARRVERSR
jgi:hypothetical protein